MAGGTTIVDRLNKLSGKDATTIAKALENLEEGGGIGGFEIHICASGEYDAETKVPTIEEPDSSTLYLVPTTEEAGDLFDEYIWTGEVWERFGAGSVNIQNPDWNESDSEAKGYIANRPIYKDVSDVTSVLYTAENITLDSQSNPGFYYYYGASMGSIEISEGDSLTINVDDVDYALEVKKNGTNLYVGAKDPSDFAGIQESTVGIMFAPNGQTTYGAIMFMMYLPNERSGGTHTFVISKTERTVSIKRLDSELLPAEIPVENLPLDEIEAAVANPYFYYDESTDALTASKKISTDYPISVYNNLLVRNGDLSVSQTTGGGNLRAVMARFGQIPTSFTQGILVYGSYPASVSGVQFQEIVGNGTKSTSPSNARTLDLDGNESLAGSLTLGMGTADEVTVTAAQLKALIALLNA